MIPRNALRCLFTAASVVTCLMQSPAARAQSEAISSSGQRYRSQQSWAMEFRMGPYRPDIDSEFTNLPPEQRPHQLYFGSKHRLLAQAELDYQILDIFGSLAIGVSAGYFHESANAFVDPGVGETPSIRSGDTTQLTLLPTSASLVYRLDPAVVRWGFPLVPYAKAGIDWVYWSVANANGAIASDKAGGRGRGGVMGFHAAAGLSLLLDIFDPGAAQEFDSETGINHTYVFVEYGHSQINGIGSKPEPRLGDTTWSAGFMFEF